MNDDGPLPLDRELVAWKDSHSPTWKPAYVTTVEGHIDNHLVPYFGSRDLRTITEDDILAFIRAKLDEGKSPGTIENTLSTLRRVYSLLQRRERVSRNPASRMGELMTRVARATATETREARAWSRTEAERLMAVARETEPAFAPLLTLLFSTGLRRGEAMGLQWADIDFSSRKITVRRSITTGGIGTPKSGRSRRIAMTEPLAEMLFDLLGERRKEGLRRGWPETPAWVFCARVGTPLEPRNSGARSPRSGSCRRP